MEVIQHWSTPFYYYSWESASEHKDELIRVAKELQEAKNVSNITPSIKVNLYESDFDFLQYDNDSVRKLAEWIRDRVWQSAADANKGYWQPGDRLGVKVHESWVHITKNSGYHDVHSHPMSSWSGIYYIEPGNSNVENKNGINRFYNPNRTMYTDPGTDFISKSGSIDIPNVAGTLVIFPSWINHSAMPYKGKADRVLMAFNSQIIRG